MRGAWLCQSFFLWWSILLVGLALRTGIVSGMGIAALGVWVILMTWVQSANEEEAFEIAKIVRFYQKTFGWSRPFTLFQKELTRENFHKDFENYKWARVVIGYPAGSLFIAVGLWLMLRVMGN